MSGGSTSASGTQYAALGGAWGSVSTPLAAALAAGVPVLNPPRAAGRIAVPRAAATSYSAGDVPSAAASALLTTSSGVADITAASDAAAVDSRPPAASATPAARGTAAAANIISPHGGSPSNATSATADDLSLNPYLAGIVPLAAALKQSNKINQGGSAFFGAALEFGSPLVTGNL